MSIVPHREVKLIATILNKAAIHDKLSALFAIIERNRSDLWKQTKHRKLLGPIALRAVKFREWAIQERKKNAEYWRNRRHKNKDDRELKKREREDISIWREFDEK